MKKIKALDATHYNIPVQMYWSESENTLKDITEKMNEKNIKFTLLPIVKSSVSIYYDICIDVLHYENKYCIICDKEHCYFITEKMPEDGDFGRLAWDILKQKRNKKEEPEGMRSKFKELFDVAQAKANKIINIALTDKYENDILCLFDKRAVELYPEEYDEWDEEYEHPGKFAYMYKLIADLLKDEGYDYDYIKTIAELDHHDVESWEVDLKYLYDGFYWKPVLTQYTQKAKENK